MRVLVYELNTTTAEDTVTWNRMVDRTVDPIV